MSSSMDMPTTPLAADAVVIEAVIEAVIDGLQRVLHGDHTPEQQRLILRNAAMLLTDLRLDGGHGHELG